MELGRVNLPAADGYTIVHVTLTTLFVSTCLSAGSLQESIRRQGPAIADVQNLFRTASLRTSVFAKQKHSHLFTWETLSRNDFVCTKHYDLVFEGV
jgi:hypothetical protein